MTEQEAKELGELEADYDRVAAVLEDEDSDEDEVAKAEQELVVIDRAMRALNDRPPLLADELKSEAGAFLVLSRNGEPTLVPQYYTKTEVITDEGVVEAVEESGTAKPKGSSLSQRLLDELAMQRRNILAIHLANDPALALDFMVFTLADADGHDWRAKKASTLVGSVASGPVTGFEAKDAPASAAMAEFAGSLDESWRAGENDVERFARFRALSDEARSAWLGHVVARTLVASLACEGERSRPSLRVPASAMSCSTTSAPSRTSRSSWRASRCDRAARGYSRMTDRKRSAMPAWPSALGWMQVTSSQRSASGPR